MLKVMNAQPDINIVIGELTLQIANLSRENAILKATVQALKAQNQAEKTLDAGELQM